MQPPAGLQEGRQSAGQPAGILQGRQAQGLPGTHPRSDSYRKSCTLIVLPISLGLASLVCWPHLVHWWHRPAASSLCHTLSPL